MCIVKEIGLNRKVCHGEMHVYLTNVTLKLHQLTVIVHPKLTCYNNLKNIFFIRIVETDQTVQKQTEISIYCLCM